MSTARHLDRSSEIVWFAASGVQPVVYVAKQESRVVAILEWKPGVGFHLTSCTGELIGQYASLQDGEAALEEWLVVRSGTGRPTFL